MRKDGGELQSVGEALRLVDEIFLAFNTALTLLKNIQASCSWILIVLRAVCKLCFHWIFIENFTEESFSSFICLVIICNLVPVVSESRFFNLETRMRVSPIQSRSSRRDREFLTLTLRLRDETEKKFPPISGIETRSRFIIFTLRLRDENENSLDLISFFETRPRILKLAIFPWNQAWTASLFCMQFLGG